MWQQMIHFNPKTMLYNSKKPVAVIPNLAIHMNREVNKGVELKVQTDLEPIVSLIGAKENTQGWLLGKIAAELGIEADSILDYELFLCNGEEPSITGFDDEFLSAPRLDNLTSCQSCLNAVMDTEALSDICNLVVLFDNEECGSSSKQGAGSVILSSILEKIYLNNTGYRQEPHSIHRRNASQPDSITGCSSCYASEIIQRRTIRPIRFQWRVVLLSR